MNNMNRRQLLKIGAGLVITVAAVPLLSRVATAERSKTGNHADEMEKVVMSEQAWREKLSAEQFDVLRREGTERPFSSELNDEKRDGTFHCAGCDQAVFTSGMKFDSGTGWPSFFDSIEGAFETKTDFKLIYPRTEYHCARCGGHHGHIFKDGPEPTGKRWCNNGVALKFIPA